MSDEAQNSSPERVIGVPFTGRDDPRRNSGGRPKMVAEVQRLARTHTVEAIEALVDVLQMRGEKVASARVAAANALLDRAWGKVGSVAADEDERNGIERDALTVEQVRALARARLEQEH